MDPQRFDQFARMLARGGSRRDVVRRAGAVIAAAAVSAGLPIGRALGQSTPATAQTCSDAWQGPLVELPPDVQAVGGDCQIQALGCKDFDGDGFCTRGYLTADCHIVEGDECLCPPPQPVCSPEVAFEPGDPALAVEGCCNAAGLECYGQCHDNCVQSGAHPRVCAKTCSRACGCSLCPVPPPPPPPPPGPFWGKLESKCSNRKLWTRIYSAVLHKIPAGQDWQTTCFNTPGTEPPVVGRKPKHCPIVGHQWGEWEIQDESCQRCADGCYPDKYSCQLGQESYACWCPTGARPDEYCPDAASGTWWVGTCFGDCYIVRCARGAGGGFVDYC